MKIKLYFLFEITLKDISEIEPKEVVNWWVKNKGQIKFDTEKETIKLKNVSLTPFDCERYNYENDPFHVYFEKEYMIDLHINLANDENLTHTES